MRGPEDLPGVTQRRVRCGDATLHVYEAGPVDGPLVLLAHGWPELAWSWRHQLVSLADAGYRVMAHDQRGFGRSTIPTARESYAAPRKVADLVDLVHSAGREQAVLVGHDWGAIQTWYAAVMVPDVFPAVCALSVPYSPGIRFGGVDLPPTQTLRLAMGDSFHYMLHFQDPAAAAALADHATPRIMRALLGGAEDSALGGSGATSLVEAAGTPPTELPAWLSEAELDVFVRAYEHTGFAGGMRWYAALDLDYEALAPWRTAPVRVPTLFVGGAEDGVVLATMPDIEALSERCLDHRGTVLIDGAGHWVQQEAPAEVDAALLTFLEETTPLT